MSLFAISSSTASKSRGSLMLCAVFIGIFSSLTACTVASPSVNKDYLNYKENRIALTDLDTIAAVQTSYIGRSADTGAPTFGSMEDFQTSKYSDLMPERLQVSNQVKLIASGEGANAHFGAAAVSDTTGKFFYIGDEGTKPLEVITFDPADTTIEMKLNAAAEAGLSGDFDGDFTN